MCCKHGILTLLRGNYQNMDPAKVLKQKPKSEEATCFNYSINRED